MSIPKISESPGVISFDFEEEKLCIKVKRVRAHADGRVVGELIITTSQDETHPHLKQCLFNFAVDRSRKELANSMSAVYPLPAPGWPSTIEALCVKVLEIVRRGEPVEELNPDEKMESPRFIIEPLILEGETNLIYGEGGSGKSTLALLCCQIAETNWWDNPLDLKLATGPGIRTLYLDWETHNKILLWNHIKLLRGTGQAFFKLRYRHCAAPLAEDIEQIQELIDALKIQMIVIDSAGMAAGGDLNKSETATSFFKALRSLKITSLLISHTSKDLITRKKTPFGSVYWFNESRNIFELNHVVSEDGNRISLGLFHRKANNSRLYRPIGFEFTYLEDMIVLDSQDIKTVAGLLEHLTISTRIIELLKKGSMTAADISQELDIKLGSVKVTLSQMKGRGKVINLDNKEWGLTSPLPEEDKTGS